MDCDTHEASQPIPLIKRKRLNLAQRQQILARYHEGQLTLKDFAVREGLSVATLNNWLRQERESGTIARPTISFKELKLPSSSGAWAMEIVTPQNWTLRLAQCPEASALKPLLGTLPC